MAKIKSIWLRGSSQRLGGAVTYMLKGVQIARELAAKVENPRTPLQMNQRVKLANVVSIYRANRAWMEKLAFETKKSNWSTYNAFVSANFATNEVALTKAQAAAGFGIVVPYIVSRGSLPTIEFNNTTANVWQSNINLRASLSISETTTIGELSEAIIATNNGLVQGMQLSLIMNYQQQSGGSYYPVVRYYEIILDTNSNEILGSRMDIAHLANIDGHLSFTRGTNDPIMGFAFVLSHTMNGTTRVSTQQLVLTSSEVYNLFTSDAAKAAAMESYGTASNNPFLESNYGQGGSNSGVVLRPDIVSVAINDRSANLVGHELGSINNESPFTLTINLSQAPEQTPVSCSIYTYGTQGTTATSTSITSEGNAVVVSFTGGAIFPENDIRTVLLTLADGVVLSAQFLHTSGDVTE